jgi:flagellar biogenesis protein FliO
MRALISAFAASISGFAVAQAGALGTKPDVATGGWSASAPSGSGFAALLPLLQMGLAVGIVCVLFKAVLPRIAGKLQKRFHSNGSTIRVAEAANVGAASLFLVEVEGRRLLLGATPQSVSLIACLEQPVAAPHDPALFEDILGASLDSEPKPTNATSNLAVVPQPQQLDGRSPEVRHGKDQIQDILARLDQLTS